MNKIMRAFKGGRVGRRIMLAGLLLGVICAAAVHSEASGMAMSKGENTDREESGVRVTVNGHFLTSTASLSDDLSSLRLPVRQVAEALKLPLKWDSKHRAVWIGSMQADGRLDHSMNLSNGAMPIRLVINGEIANSDADLIFMGRSVYASAEPFAKALNLHYTYDTANHRIMLVTQEAARQFTEEEAAVRDVLNGRGMIPHIAEDGTKEFTLTAEMHAWSPVNGILTTAWTFNGQVAGPTIRVTEGDKVRIRFVNKLHEPSTVHWHGLLLPNAMDGVPGITQAPVQPDGSFLYEFTASHAGTFIYHSHYDDMVQMGSGMYGAFIIDPIKPEVEAEASGPLSAAMKFDHDYTMVLGGFHINTTMEDEEDYYTINGRSYPDTPPIEMKMGETARIRMINMDPMEVHTMHLHGIDFYVIARNGSPVSSPEKVNTVLFGPGETVDIAFRGDNPGDWMFHCHIMDHTMNGEDSMAAGMGGLVTLVKVTK